MQRNYLYGIFGCLLFIFIGLISRASETEGSHQDTTTCETTACTRGNSESPMGTNLGAAKDWSSEYPFTDAFKLSRPWILHDFADGVWDTLEQDLLDADANGWVKSLPTSDAEANFRTIGTLMFTKLANQYPEGEYIVYYEGEGTIEYGRDARKNEAKSRDGRHVIDVTHGDAQYEGGIYLQITETDPNGTGNYIRNIRVAMPGFSETDLDTQLFHPQFLDSISRYKVLRMMDWMETNHAKDPLARRRTPRQPLTEPIHPLDQDEYNPLLNQRDWEIDLLWEERAQATDARFSTDKGVPIEIMTRLANQLGADPWFNMPHQASNHFMWAFAQVTLEELDPNRLVFIEFSNEVWNSGFGQSVWVEQQAIAKWPDSAYTSHELRYIWHGMRSAEMCNIWKDTWGDQAHRVRCVLNTQAANLWVGEHMLDCPLYEEAPCDRFHDIVAIAPYFGQHIGNSAYESIVQQWADNLETGLDQLFIELEHGTILDAQPYIFKATMENVNDQMAKYGKLTQERGLGYMTYEGGQHLVGVGPTLNNESIAILFASANRDPRMKALYQDHLDVWHEVGGQIFTHYSNTSIYSKFGNWGAQEFYEQPMAAKHESIQQHIETTPCLWEMCSERITYDYWLPIVITLEDQ